MGGLRFLGKDEKSKPALSLLEKQDKLLLKLEKEQCITEQSLKLRTESLGRRQKILEEKARLIQKLEQDLAEKHEQLKKKAVLAENESLQVSKLEEGLKTRKSSFSEMSEKLRQDEAGLMRQERTAVSRQKELAKLQEGYDKSLAALKDKLGRLQGEVAAKEQKLAELVKGCDNAEASLKKSSGELQLLVSRKIEEEKSLRQRMKELDKLGRELSAREKGIKSREGKLSAAEAGAKEAMAMHSHLKKLEGKLSDKEKGLEQQFGEKESRMAAIQLNIQKQSDELAMREEVLGKKQEDVSSRERAVEKEEKAFENAKAEAETLLRHRSVVALREKNASEKEAALNKQENELALLRKELEKKGHEIAAALSRLKSREERLSGLRREVSQEQKDFEQVKNSVMARSSRIEREYAVFEAKQEGLDERQLKLAECKKGIQKMKEEATQSIMAANTERLRLASMVKAAEREKKELLNQREILEAFHQELLNKEAIAARRLEAVQNSLKDFELKEKQAQANLADAFGKLSDVNKKLVAAEKRLEKTVLLCRDYEGKIDSHAAHFKNITAELGHLRRIKKGLEQEFAEVGAIEKTASYIGALLKLGELEKAIRAYESLRVTYSAMDRNIKKKLYPKLIDLHYTIAEHARKESSLSPKL